MKSPNLDASGLNEAVDMAALRGVRVDGAGERPPRVTLFCRLLENAVRGKPPVEDMGWRMWLMLERLAPGSVWRLKDAEERRAVLRVAREAGGALDLAGVVQEVAVEDVQRVACLLVAGEDQPRRLGRRVMLLAYAFCRESGPVRAALESFEDMGQHLGLTANNKRSAVSAAMKVLVKSIIESGELRHQDHPRTELWFAKKRETRERCARAQRGNENRRNALAKQEEQGEDSAKAELAEVLEGVPVKPEWRGLTASQVRQRLSALHEEAERRRLGV